MKTLDERLKGVEEKISYRVRLRRRVISAVCTLAVLIGVLCIPLFGEDIHADPADPYAVLAGRLEQYYRDVNRFDEDIAIIAPGQNASGNSNGSYIEVTDNQTEGVREGDLCKRSDKYAFYITQDGLMVYSIDKADSRLVGSYPMELQNWNVQMFLSQDCSTVTVLYTLYGPNCSVTAVALDVSNVSDIRQIGSVTTSGSLRSARMIGDEILFTTSCYVDREGFDPKDYSTYVPYVRANGINHYVDPKCIHYPDTLASGATKMLVQLNAKTLEFGEPVAFLGFHAAEYISRDHVYICCPEYEWNGSIRDVTSRVYCIAYGGDGLREKNTFRLPGTIEDQYSMDEFDGDFRAVSTTFGTNGSNASLYVFDLETGSQKACIENFAPNGERVRSVRFHGTQLTVCTAAELRDPVFIFDLTDLEHITWQDTGEIFGYSENMVDFGEDTYLGIGVGGQFWSDRSVKLEVYRKGTEKVESVAVYEIPNAYSSGNYKSYFVDREHGLVGVGYELYHEGKERYILLRLADDRFEVLLDIPMTYYRETNRAFLDDGWFYLLNADPCNGIRVYELG